ncbi:MAG TPA: hypothetical protein VIW94_07295 [Acidimicrobiia bacterium]
MFHEYSYEVVRKFNEERLEKSHKKWQILQSTGDSYLRYEPHDAEIVEIAFGFDCDHVEQMGA